MHHGPAAGAGAQLGAALWDAGGEFAPALFSPSLAVLGVGWLRSSVPLRDSCLGWQSGFGWDVATAEVLWLLPRSPGTALWSQMKSEILP